jgi:hypothetical protein
VKQTAAQLPTLMEAPGVSVRSTPWGGMACTYGELAAGTDLTDAFKGLPGDACQCPHWGYVLRGALRIRYADGADEVIRAGEMFYLPPGHTPRIEEDTAFVEFSPQGEYDEVIAHLRG